MKDTEFNYINVIPLVDVMLVLLTIVLTTSTFIATGLIPIELPKASKGGEDMLKTLTIEIDRSGNIHLDTETVSLEFLCACLRERQKDLPILIRADRSVELQVFVDVLDIVKTLGFSRVNLQTEQRV